MWAFEYSGLVRGREGRLLFCEVEIAERMEPLFLTGAQRRLDASQRISHPESEFWTDLP